MRMCIAAGLPVQTTGYVCSALKECKNIAHVENLIGGDHEITTCVSSLTLILAFLRSFKTLLT